MGPTVTEEDKKEREADLQFEASSVTFFSWENSIITDLGNQIKLSLPQSGAIYWTPEHSTKSGDTVSVSLVDHRENSIKEVTLVVDLQDHKYSLKVDESK